MQYALYSPQNMMHFYQTFESGPFSPLQHLSPTLADAGIAGQPVRSNFQVDALVISKGLRLSETIATDVFFGTFAADGAHFAFGARWLIAHSCIANKNNNNSYPWS